MTVKYFFKPSKSNIYIYISSKAKKSFTLVELLVAMAIMAILMGLAVYGVTVVQQNVRDTARINKIKEFDVALNGELASGRSLPYTFTANGGFGTATLAYSYSPNGRVQIQLHGHLQRGEPSGAVTPLYFVTDTSPTSTNYCYSLTGTPNNVWIYVIGVKLESGKYFFRTNTGNMYTAFSQTINGVSCLDDIL